jgi:protein FrlC
MTTHGTDRPRLLGCNAQYGRLSLAAFAAAQRELGITGIDCYGSAAHLWCDRDGCDPAGLRAALAGHGLEVAAFSVRNYGYSLCAEPGTLRREASLAYYAACLEAAAALGAPLVCLEPAGACQDRPAAAALDACLETLGRLEALAGGLGLALAVGQTPAGQVGPAPDLAGLARLAAARPGLRVFLDTALLAAAGTGPARGLAALGGRVALVRFVDGRNDGCRVWGEGVLPCGGTLDALRAAGFRGPLALHLSGDRYALDPVAADRRNHAALAQVLRERGF